MKISVVIYNWALHCTIVDDHPTPPALDGAEAIDHGKKVEGAVTAPL